MRLKLKKFFLVFLSFIVTLVFLNSLLGISVVAVEKPLAKPVIDKTQKRVLETTMEKMEKVVERDRANISRRSFGKPGLTTSEMLELLDKRNMSSYDEIDRYIRDSYLVSYLRTLEKLNSMPEKNMAPIHSYQNYISISQIVKAGIVGRNYSETCRNHDLQVETCMELIEDTMKNNTDFSYTELCPDYNLFTEPEKTGNYAVDFFTSLYTNGKKYKDKKTEKVCKASEKIPIFTLRKVADYTTILELSTFKLNELTSSNFRNTQETMEDFRNNVEKISSEEG